MQEQYSAREGYLVLADISGYTKFLTGTELEHSQAIIHELTTLVHERLAPPMTFVKLEGDAVFCYADSAVFRDGERFMELLEVCYFEFSNRMLNMARNTTCRCAACAAIGALDLKFVCHYGTFVIDATASGVDLAGPDVILVHRLLKNTVVESTGVNAYALLTDACLQQLPAALDLPRHEEQYESFGVIAAGVHDLQPVLVAMRDARRISISPEDADLVITVEVPVPLAAAWQYWVDPVERQRWTCRQFSKEPDRVTRNAEGRVARGAAMHCNHGPGTWTYEFLDWQPFSSVTSVVIAPRIGAYLGLRNEFETFDFESTPDGGTRVSRRFRLKNRSRLSLSAYRIQRRFIAAYWNRAHRELLSVIAEDNAVKSANATPSAGRGGEPAVAAEPSMSSTRRA